MACGTADVMIWNVLENANCSFRSKAVDKKFCRHCDNVTGVCDRKSCPLANSQYATTRLVAGKLYLETKTAERAHMPNKLWDKIELPEDILKGMDMIQEELVNYYDDWIIEKCKQRYVRLVETLNNMRAMRKAPKVKELPIKKRIERRNAAREERALSVAHVAHHVKEELLKRLNEGVYGEIYNLEEDEFNEALDEYEQPMEFVDEDDFEEIEEYDEEEEKAELVHA